MSKVNVPLLQSPAIVISAIRSEPRVDRAAQVDVVTERGNAAEHLAQVPGDGDLVHRPRDFAILDPEAGGAARIVAGHRVDALPHHLGDQQAGTEPPQQRLRVEHAALDHEVVHAAGVARRHQAELARGIGVEQVTAEHAVDHELAIARRDALAVEGRRAERARQVRTLGQRHPVGEHLFALRVEQEAAAAILRRASDRAGEVPDQPASELGREQDRRLTRRELAGAEPLYGLLGGLAADGLDVFQPAPVTRRRVPVVALHVTAVLADHYAAHAVRRRRIAADEAMAVAEDAQLAMSRNRGALGVADAVVESEARRFAAPGELDRRRRLERPRMAEIEIGKPVRHSLRVGQPGVLVVRSEACD